MSSLLDRSLPPARRTGDPSPSPLTAAVQAALRAAAAGLVPVAAPVVMAWMLGAGGRATWSQAVRLALGLWLLGQHAGLAVSGGHVGLVPLGLALVPLTSTWYAGRRLARALDPRADRIAAGVTRAKPARLAWRWLLVFTGAYGVVAVLASIAADMPGLRPVSAQAVIGALVVAFVGGGAGAAAYRFRGLRPAVRAVLRRIPEPVRPWVRPALAAQAVQLAAGAAAVATVLVAHFDGVTAMHRALDPGAAGTAVLTLGEVLLLPNLMLWAAAVMAGPGFAIGSGTSVTVVASQLGPLPAVPLLAALPAPGELPVAARALLAVPVIAGVVAGVIVVRMAPGATVVTRLGHALGAGVLSGVASGVLAWLSGGPAGPGRLAETGPDPLWTGAAAGGEATLGMLVTVLVVAAVPRLLDVVDALALRAVTTRPATTPGSGGAAPADAGRTPGDTPSGPGA